jgi:hypothetical protein
MRLPGAWGTHPGLDPLWSTETLEFVHDSALRGRLPKIALVATNPVARRTLRVCWHNPDDAYNCGRCEKCLRTMAGLVLHEALDQVETLPPRLDPEAFGSMVVTPAQLGLWRDLRRRLAAAGHRDELLVAVDRALTTGETPPVEVQEGKAPPPGQRATWLTPVRRALRRVLGPLGQDPPERVPRG